MSERPDKPVLHYASRRDVPDGEGKELYDGGNLALRMALFFVGGVALAVALAMIVVSFVYVFAGK